MRIESVEWSQYHLSAEDLIEVWGVAAAITAVLKALIRVRGATEENLEKAVSSLKL